VLSHGPYGHENDCSAQAYLFFFILTCSLFLLLLHTCTLAFSGVFLVFLPHNFYCVSCVVALSTYNILSASMMSLFCPSVSLDDWCDLVSDLPSPVSGSGMVTSSSEVTSVASIPSGEYSAFVAVGSLARGGFSTPVVV
jgi:hypothetical protein